MLNERATDGAIFNSESTHIAGKVAVAALAAGLFSGSVEQFVGFIVSQDQAGVASVPGATDEIIAAGTKAVFDTHVRAFHCVWLSAIPSLAIAAIGKVFRPEGIAVEWPFAKSRLSAAVFLIDPCEEFNHLIDAPLQESEHGGEGVC
ncbi:unnamed protein product [Discula destructiva]